MCLRVVLELESDIRGGKSQKNGSMTLELQKDKLVVPVVCPMSFVNPTRYDPVTSWKQHFGARTSRYTRGWQMAM